jgi:hypothetical protein
MENLENLEDDFLRKMIGKMPLEEPSADFTEKVMASVKAAPSPVQTGSPAGIFLRNSWPYLLIAAIVAVILATSDVPFSRYFPGYGYLTDTLLPYLGKLFGSIGSVVVLLRSGPLPLIIILSMGILVAVDYFLGKRRAIHTNFTV